VTPAKVQRADSPEAKRSTRTSMWKLWRTVSGGFVPTKMWQKCFFTTTMRGHTQVCIPERPSQSFGGLSCLIHLTSREGKQALTSRWQKAIDSGDYDEK
jgi:hypothetical protein